MTLSCCSIAHCPKTAVHSQVDVWLEGMTRIHLNLCHEHHEQIVGELPPVSIPELQQ
jgi:hypothetical protein